MLRKNEEEKDLADSGRLFLCNLPYTSTEGDLEGLFSSYGRALLLTVHGRMLYRLPSTIRKEASEDTDTPGSSYKKNVSKDKASSSSSHDWNTLFMGPNAVADVIAQKYSGTKSQVLDYETKDSVAICVALGETQLVQEVRRFLLHNGVNLDSISQNMSKDMSFVLHLR
ncbi:putative RNA-binding protein 19 [Sciurus carolinensis]|uniref:RNA-binding protein 19 n=1 Tax=Sciurus carolinensis TaxID=30640 RepID=A0AA41NFM5_SCICA|nr:putative RNA-binding protein 19 [Sciurus carolinensis]